MSNNLPKDMHGNVLKIGDKVKRVRNSYFGVDLVIGGVYTITGIYDSDLSATSRLYISGNNAIPNVRYSQDSFVKVAGANRTPAIKRNTNITIRK